MSSNQEAIDKSVERFGVAYLYDDEVLDPTMVTRFTKIKDCIRHLYDWEHEYSTDDSDFEDSIGAEIFVDGKPYDDVYQAVSGKEGFIIKRTEIGVGRERINGDVIVILRM